MTLIVYLVIGLMTNLTPNGMSIFGCCAIVKRGQPFLFLTFSACFHNEIVQALHLLGGFRIVRIAFPLNLGGADYLPGSRLRRECVPELRIGRTGGSRTPKITLLRRAHMPILLRCVGGPLGRRHPH